MSRRHRSEERPEAYYEATYQAWRRDQEKAHQRQQRREAREHARRHAAGPAATAPTLPVVEEERLRDAPFWRTYAGWRQERAARLAAHPVTPEEEEAAARVAEARSFAATYFAWRQNLAWARRGPLAWWHRMPRTWILAGDALLVLAILLLLASLTLVSGVFREAGKVPRSMDEAADSLYHRQLQEEMAREERALRSRPADR